MTARHVQLVLPAFPRATYQYPAELVEPIDYEIQEPCS